MKEINGTVTLAYVEEDNKQRVIFRVIPLCTREGSAFNGGTQDFPDEGSLRIVPDKREQSTFKDRMHEIGGLCAIYLVNDGKELIKVRQNRNYAPEQGEKNQLAIYSDVICEFAEDGCFEVLNEGDDGMKALTPKVIIHKDKVLYGPVEKEAAAQTKVEALHPFGNDHFLLHSVEASIFGKRQIYWDPEAVMNWRQRRSALRRRERGSEDETAPEETMTAAETPAESAPAAESQEPAPVATPPVRPAAPKPIAPVKAAETAAPAASRGAEPSTPAPAAPLQTPFMPETPDAPAESAGALPIGTKLDILDADLTFDQQLSRLDQNLSNGANRLSVDEEAPEEEPEEVVSHFNGTPLVKSAKPITRSKSKPESLQHVVEKQMMRQSEDEGTNYKMVENPIENLRASLDYVWQNSDTRTQAIDALSDNETFMQDMLQAFRRKGLNVQATAAAQEQLAEIEAERLSLLMQLDAAKANEKQYRENAVAALSQKLRGESDKLKQEVKGLNDAKENLTAALQALSASSAQRVVDFLAQNIQCLSGAAENRLLLSPVIGQHYTAKELAEKLRVHMNESGYGVNEDDAMGLLIYFSINDVICLSAEHEADACRFAQIMLESFGLQSVSGVIQDDSYVEIVSLLPENGQRTPTVTVQKLCTDSMSIYGHKTIYYVQSQTLDQLDPDKLAAYPVVKVPVALKPTFGRTNDWEAVKPASISSFMDIKADVHPLLDEAEKWFSDFKACLVTEQLSVPQTMLIDMRRYIEVASRKVRGGFLAAADSAVCHWIVPAVRLNRFDANRLSSMLAGLPKALQNLHIH